MTGELRWHRADFILRGEYCPLSEVRDHLDDLRQRLGADVLIHIAADHELVMRSLSWAVGTPESAVAALSSWIRQSSYRRDNYSLNNELVALAREPHQNPIVDMGGTTAARVIEGLLKIRNREATPRLLDRETRRTFAERSWGGSVLSHTGKPGVVPWDGEVRSIVLTSPPVRPADIVEVRDLGVKIKCTAESNARRDSVVMQRVTAHLSFPASSGESSIGEVAANALALATDITDSNGGAVYFRVPSDKPLFRRIAVQTDAGHAFPEEIQERSGTTVEWSVQKHRAYQSIRGSSAAEMLTPTVQPEGNTELVTPIAGPVADLLRPASGAIVVFRSEGLRGYSAYERALVRNVALRLALFRTNIATREIANAIAVLRAGSPSRLQPTLGSPSERATAIWPKDIGKATARFAGPLSQLAESTHSHSVTLRIALPDPRSNSIHGLALVRVAAHPAERIYDPFERVMEEDPGPHWQVMRDGREVYVPVATADTGFPVLRPGTVSMLCVPVKVEGILTGTLHLESPFADNYAPYLPLVVALSGAVGRTLADARAELEVGLLDKAAQGLARRHDYSGVLTDMKERLASVEPADLRQGLIRSATQLQTLIKELREPELPERLPEPTLWEIVRESVDESLIGRSITQPAEPIFHQPMVPRATRALTTVLENVWDNVERHSTKSGWDALGRRTVPRIRFGTAELDGRTQAVVAVENMSFDILDEKSCAALHRYPAEGRAGEMRLGTYIAGLNARRIGARIHAMPIEGGRGLRTILIVPVEDLRDPNSSH
jgi:GAF domain-containing protein